MSGSDSDSGGEGIFRSVLFGNIDTDGNVDDNYLDEARL